MDLDRGLFARTDALCERRRQPISLGNALRRTKILLLHPVNPNGQTKRAPPRSDLFFGCAFARGFERRSKERFLRNWVFSVNGSRGRNKELFVGAERALLLVIKLQFLCRVRTVIDGWGIFLFLGAKLV